MKQLKVHGEEVNTVFELLGSDENAMTYSLGWALSKSDIFCQHLAKKLGLRKGFSDTMDILLQEHKSQGGFTDIEIVDPDRFHIVIEAKRGFNIPSSEQLEKYAERLINSKEEKMLVVLAESDRKEHWLKSHVPKKVNGVDVKAISWKQFQGMAQACITETNKHDEKRLLHQLIQYLNKVTTMQNQNSNLVYVVSVGTDVIFEDVTFIKVIEDYNKYFHPIESGWPAEPPNYIAFRYDGKLQSIHHIESYKVIYDFQQDFKLKKSCPAGEKHYLYELGPAIKPTKEVRTIDKAKGYMQIQRAARCWCFIDLLLTCDSISEASKRTKDRDRQNGSDE